MEIPIPAASEESRCLVRLVLAQQVSRFTGFDTYDEISRAQENKRLDNFVIALKEQPGRTGYIIGYGGRRSRIREAAARTQSARNYLIRAGNFPATQLKVIDGGYREKASVELHIMSPGGCPPTATPTIDPRMSSCKRVTESSLISHKEAI